MAFEYAYKKATIMQADRWAKRNQAKLGTKTLIR